MRWLKRLGLVLTFPVLLVLVLALYVGAKWAFHSQDDDAERIASKAAYLQTVAQSTKSRSVADRPNVLILFYDDLGYGDFGFTGSQAIKTPNIDALAAAGTVLSNFHSASPVCSPARAALLTGRLPPRAGMPQVVYPSGKATQLINILSDTNTRIPFEEITLADVLKADGYRTGMIGKWHLGDTAPSLPNRMGFDSFFGALHSNDMQPFALWRNDQIEVADPADQDSLDRRYTDEALRFITASAADKRPFFLYFAHNFPHEPLHAAPADRGKSAAGLYGDVVERLDRGVGEIVAALKASGKLDNTIIILTSDNGPWFEGSPGAARGRKGQTFEGGMHVPFLVHWPKGLSGGRSLPDQAMGNDLFPTLLDWLAIPLPSDRKIDGQSLKPMLAGQFQAPRVTYYYSGKQLMAVSDGRYKYHDRQPILYVLSNGSWALPFPKGPWLFDLSTDPGEAYDVSMLRPAEAARLKAALDARRAEDQDNSRGWLAVH
jgi:uncharacterized sulfatase